jgi:hypothetical protein
VDLVSRSPHFWATLDADSVRPYLPDLPILLPVASFQRRDYQFRHPPRLPLCSAPVAVDTGAFAWFRSYSSYHFSAPQYAEWIDGVRPPVAWAVIPDQPTEDLCGPRDVRRAQAATTEAIVHVLATLLDVPWSWTPVLQGRTVEDYLRHAVELAGILYDLAAVYAQRRLSFRVGLGPSAVAARYQKYTASSPAWLRCCRVSHSTCSARRWTFSRAGAIDRRWLCRATRRRGTDASAPTFRTSTPNAAASGFLSASTACRSRSRATRPASKQPSARRYWRSPNNGTNDLVVTPADTQEFAPMSLSVVNSKPYSLHVALRSQRYSNGR